MNGTIIYAKIREFHECFPGLKKQRNWVYCDEIYTFYNIYGEPDCFTEKGGFGLGL